MGRYGVAVVNNVVRVWAAGLGTVGLIRGAEQEEGEGDGSEEQKGDEVDKQSEEASNSERIESKTSRDMK